LQPSADVIQTSNFDVEYAEGITTAQKRVSTKLSDFPRVATLRSLFASVKVLSIHAEVRQDTMLSSSDGFFLRMAMFMWQLSPLIRILIAHREPRDKS